ncbi:MAG: NRDE family protein [Bacteroidia bacterium]
MCTVTYVPINKGFILTSNRDEKIFRSTILPEVYKHKQHNIIYPKDTLSGGTWVASSYNRKIACLLNGAFIKHTNDRLYAKSRGKVLLEIFDYDSFGEFVEKVYLKETEPFTLIFIDFTEKIVITQMIWDGKKKYVQNIPSDLPQIWASVTLYDEKIQLQKRKFFNEWLQKNKDFDDLKILGFHYSHPANNEQVGNILKHTELLQTVSITQIKVTNEIYTFFYHDLLSNQTKIIDLQCIQELQ